MRAWRSARGNVQLFCQSRRYASNNAPKGGNIAAILGRDEPIEDAQVNGWVRSIRKQKKIAFAALGDGSTLDPLQAVMKPEQAEQ